MSKHSEGAWEAKQMPDGVWTVRTIYHDDQGRRVTAWPAVCNAGVQPNEANATLFAASKDMLKALRINLAFAEHELELRQPSADPDYIAAAQQAVDSARAAISKATLTRNEGEVG